MFGMLLLCGAVAGAEWAPAEGPLMTRWAAEVSPDNVLPEYPRPQMKRNAWQSLNGLWDYAVRPKDLARIDTWDGEILVPFAIESALSGVGRRVSPEEELWYRREFETPALADGGRLLLHFGAVDWRARVWVNGKQVGEHKGGYDPFSFDITKALKPAGPQELRVAVWDPTSTGTQPRGKQLINPRGIWYTPVTGIWQTVWLEPVPADYIQSILPVSDIDESEVRLRITGTGGEGKQIRAVIKDGIRTIGIATGPAFTKELVIPVVNAKLWSPESPFLYNLEVSLVGGGRVVDKVYSYTALRKISLEADASGQPQLFLNNERLFQYGPLDQGWWPDGLYTAPTDAALRYDIEMTLDLGFNMLRKHVKVEPARFYYHCDQLGMLVWQDMPSAAPARESGGADNPLWVGANDAGDAERPEESARQFEAELRELIQDFGHFPCIVMWVPFNEGWGQYDTERIAQWVKELDPSRLVNSVSGWLDLGVGDVYDYHAYPGPTYESAGPGRASVLGEFGGLGLPLEGHLWQEDGNWGYQAFDDKKGLAKRYETLMEDLYGVLGLGMAAAIYTQTTDVEVEVNGLMTYDREVVKFDAETMKSLGRSMPARAG